jgi:uncharacterized repeat protein (TIGR03803 family)
MRTIIKNRAADHGENLMPAATWKDLALVNSGQAKTNQLKNPQSSGRGWLRPSVKRAVVTLTALFLSLVGAGPLAQAQTFTVLHNFAGANGPDGAAPYAGLMMDSSHNLYGTTESGGFNGSGTVFKIDSKGNESVLHNFSGNDGADPDAGLIMDSSGNLYGTTSFGGSSQAGTVFKLTPGGLETVLLSMNGNVGIYPFAGLVKDSQGNLYGAASSDGTSSCNCGTVFKLDSSGNGVVFHNFAGSDGEFPLAGLIMDSQGNLYGTTPNGGASGAGTVFKLDSTGNATVLHSFVPSTDGGYPESGLIMDSAGNLYGTTSYRGSSANGGTVFKVDPSGHLTVLHVFSGNDGLNPFAGLVMDSSGNLYGTTAYGGSNGAGTVFKIDPSGTESVLHSFNASTDGGYPYAGLMIDASGNLYGTTAGGGSSSDGTVFEITFTEPFESFRVKLDTTCGHPPGFDMKALFTQGSGAAAIDPATQSITVTVGTYTVTFPAGSFKVTKKGWWVFDGKINGVSLEGRLLQTGTNSYQLQLTASRVDLNSLTNPVTVTLALGNNTGTTQVKR